MNETKRKTQKASWYQRNKHRIRAKKAENMRRYRAEKPDHYREQSRQAKARLRNKLFDMYGRECEGCGFNDERALTLDHKLNNGAEERRELGERGVYQRAASEYRPTEYRIICMNCQFIARIEANRQNQHG